MRVISEIWIINSSGLTLFNLSKDDKVDPILVGGFLSAVQSFVKELGESELKTLVLGDSKITVYQGKGGYLFVSRSTKKVKDETVINYLKLAETKFFAQYGNILGHQVVDPSLFVSFGNVITEIFEDTPEKRTKAALW